jgi:uncharacterized protein YunC (DUF1805 family)
MAMILKQNNIAGKVFGIEHVPQLVKKSIENVKKANADLITEGYLDLRGEEKFCFFFKNSLSRCDCQCVLT